MKIIRLIHWNKDEAVQKAKLIRLEGYRVIHRTPAGGKDMRDLFDHPPAAFVIDLSRLPAQGRDLGMILRKTKSTRHVPLLYIDGEPDKVKSIQKILPDAVYSEWGNINASIKQALISGSRDPVVPASLFDVYAGKPLIQKLGIKNEMKVGLLRAPTGFEQILGTLPEGVRINKTAKESCDLLLWFVKSRKILESLIKKIALRQDYKSVWIIWPKKGAVVITDLSQQIIRRIGLEAGLVDYKICAVNQTWSGLLFTRRQIRTVNAN
jgi:hypothetical protein